MTNHVIPTPGNGMRDDGCPKIAITGGGDDPLTITVTYFIAQDALQTHLRFVELRFLDVLEFRWLEWEVAYETHPQHEDDYEFSLIEVTDSAYVKALLADKTATVTEAATRHFRMGVDDWGDLNIISRAVEVRTIDKQPEPGKSDNRA